MGKLELEGIALAVSGYEEDYLDLGEEYRGITEIVEEASGIGSPPWDILTAFDYPGDSFWQPSIDTYRQETGRQYPPVYHVKIVCEAEELSLAETEAYWVKRQAEWLQVQEVSDGS